MAANDKNTNPIEEAKRIAREAAEQREKELAGRYR